MMDIFFYLENKIYFEDTTEKIFYYQELNNLNETIYYKNSVSIFKMMEENEYKTAKKELTEASLPILKPMMKEVDSALGKTTYKINVNSINDIDITAFKKTNKVQIFNKDITSTTPSWMLVILGYLNVNGINLSNPTNIMTNLTIFDDYKNIKGFFTELFSTIVAFTTNFFDDDLVAKLSEVNSKYHNCYNDTDETNLLMIVYGDNWDEYPYRFYKDYKITTQERADKTLTEVVCLLYKYGDDFKFFLSTQDESKFTGIRKLLNEINTKIKTIEVPTL